MIKNVSGDDENPLYMEMLDEGEMEQSFDNKAATLMAALVFGCIGLVLVAATVRFVIWILV
jgi:hypothetical protein